MRSKTCYPRYVVEDVDRHGNVRLYFKRRGRHRKIRLHETPGTAGFLREYETALAAEGEDEPERASVGRPATPGTWRWLSQQYMQSAEFQQLDPYNTQRPRRGIIESTWLEPREPGSPDMIGECPVDKMTRRFVLLLRDRKKDFPDAANNRLKAIRRVFRWAIEHELVTSNPALDVPALRTRTGGHRTWTCEDVARFEARHPIGTSPALALGLLRYTGQRRSDVVRFGRQHIRDGALRFVPFKNRNRSPTTLELPIHPALQKIIDASLTGDLTFLVTEQGRPFTAAGFGNWFRDRCNEAGLHGCSAHGLRKTAATVLAEAGASAHQLMAWFGWKSLKEAERYTQAANQKKLAASVVQLFGGER